MRIAPLICLALLACQRTQIHRVLPPDVRIDVFPQVDRAQLDALFVVDNSRFMAVHQQRVAAAFHRFVDYLDQNQIDWHVGLVTSDVSAQPGVYQGGGYRHYHRGGGFWPGFAIGAGVGSAYGYYDNSPYYYDDSYGYYDDSTVAAGPPAGDDAVAYCMQRYRSYDPASGTYLGNDGLRHPCPAQ